ncbi:PASTA domain-containing protein [Anoxynatronum buryatiense]|uniref:Uncharacterized protein n=1 Tax=Anoxynatronum buryatiense TaxID=489973 RepID=A0AA45WUI4_9CLOT|nr:PASTA domain-containing protein [Anoxynatronum buryatiense]SMP47479.1 hypothetical protein SAMN06296020_103151 [Anoxynatronum buryatiense]
MDYPDLLGQHKEEAVSCLSTMELPFTIVKANTEKNSLSGEQRIIRQQFDEHGKTVLLIAYF